MANGNGKKKRKKYYIIGGAVAGVIILAVILGFTSGSTKIDSTKLAKVEKDDLAKSVGKDGVVTAQQLDEAQKNYELAVNKQNIARANLTVDKSKVAQEQALVAQSRANLEQAQEEYRNSTIVAPIDGLVLSRNVEVGD